MVDMSFVKEWAVELNMSEEQVQKKFDAALKEMQSMFPKQDAETLALKAKFKVKVDHKRLSMSSELPFVGVVLASDEPRDTFVTVRNDQLAKYQAAKEEATKTGDDEILQNCLKNKYVRLEKDENGNEKVIPLWPKTKRDGTPSKVAGKDMPTSEESMSRTVYGFCTPAGKQETKGFILELKGEAYKNDLHEGSVVSFKSLDKSEEGSSLYSLQSYRTEFIPTEDAHMQEGLTKLGLHGIVKKFFGDRFVTWDMINEWVAKKKDNPKDEVVPDKFRNGLTVIPESLCVYQNFSPDAKDRIKLHLTGMTDNVDDTTIRCLIDKRFDKVIDFAVNSKVLALGRLWIPAPQKEGQEVGVMLWTSGVFAYSDWKIPRVDIKKMSEKELMQNSKPAQQEPAQEYRGVNAPDEPKPKLPDTANSAGTPQAEPTPTPTTKSDDPW